jgi:integrase/recombinase XerD
MTGNASPLRPLIARYLELHRALGKGFHREQRVLESLERWLVDTAATDLGSGEFIAWCESLQHLASGVRRDQMRIVRNFCLYRRRSEPACYVPDLRLFPANHQPAQPYIFTDAQIAQLIQAADGLARTPHAPLRAEVYHLAIVLLYTTGLRRGELLRLRLGDYAPQQRTLWVRPSKFHKARYLPLSTDTVREIGTYLQLRRDRPPPIGMETPLIGHGCPNETAYSGVHLGRGLRALFRQVGIRTPDGRLPRTHDIRHSFAANALLRWYRADVDIQAKLPLLATYMGHVSIVSTERYLHFIEEVAAMASERFAAHFGAAVTPPPDARGGGQ